MHKFKELIVWQKSRVLVKKIYVLCQKFPSEEKFGLALQLKRAAISVASNIAEGAGRSTNPDFIRFLDIANGSCCEVETQLYLALDLNFVNNEDFEQVYIETQNIQKLIFNFRKTLEK